MPNRHSLESGGRKAKRSSAECAQTDIKWMYDLLSLHTLHALPRRKHKQQLISKHWPCESPSTLLPLKSHLSAGRGQRIFRSDGVPQSAHCFLAPTQPAKKAVINNTLYWGRTTASARRLWLGWKVKHLAPSEIVLLVVWNSITKEI